LVKVLIDLSKSILGNLFTNSVIVLCKQEPTL
jgi:hypothetical protein